MVLSSCCQSSQPQLIVRPGLTKLLDRYPVLRVELVTSVQSLNLARREADIALRFSRPQDDNLIIRRVRSQG